MKMNKVIFLLLFFIFNPKMLISQDFEVSPVKLFFNAEPGQTQTIPVTIINHSNTKTSFVLSIGDYVVNKEGEKLAMPAASTEHSLANWLSINPPFIEINPNQERQILISIQAPAGDFSTRWANIFVRTSQEQTALLADKVLQAGVLVTGQIILRVVQSPKTNINYKVKIGNLNELVTSNDSIRTFSATIDNLGDKISNCKIAFIASSMETGKETKLDEIFVESYPDAQLNIKLKMKVNLSPGKYALAAILDYGNKMNLEGTQIIVDVK